MKEAVTTKLVEKVTPAAEHVAASGMDAILSDPYTWITLSFVVFLGLFIRFVAPSIGKALDARSDKIRDQLEQASRLRTEAQELLASYQREQQAMLKEAEHIVITAKKDAAELRVRAAEDLKLALDRRSQQAHEKIARAEAEAVAQIRTRIIESATDMARDMLAQKAQSQSEEQMVATTIAAIKQQVH